MSYSDWLYRAFHHLRRDIHLWVLAIPWLFLRWLIAVLGGGLQIGWEQHLSRSFQHPSWVFPLLFADNFWGMMRGLLEMYARLLGPRFFLVVSIWVLMGIGWVIYPFIAGSIIHHTMPSHRTPPRWQESVTVALHRFPHLFLISVLVMLPLAVVALLLLGGTGALLHTLLTTQEFPSLFVGGLCLGVPLLLLLSLAAQFYLPLAYEAVIQDALPVDRALARAWSVLRRRLGPVLVLGLIPFALTSLVSGVMNVLTMPILLLGFRAQGVWVWAGWLFWAALSLIVAGLSVAVDVFRWVLYTVAWPDLTASDDTTA